MREDNENRENSVNKEKNIMSETSMIVKSKQIALKSLLFDINKIPYDIL